MQIAATGGNFARSVKRMERKQPYARRVNLEYALIQGLYWAGFCGIVSFAAVYLQARGYSNVGLGQVLAYGYVLGLLLPQQLAAWIDRSKSVTAYHCLWGLFLAQTVMRCSSSRS